MLLMKTNKARYCAFKYLIYVACNFWWQIDLVVDNSDLQTHLTEAIGENISRQKQTLKEVSAKNQVRI